MGVSTNYLGHVDIEPGLNKAEYDYLTAFSESRRSVRPGGPYEVSPRDPDYGEVDNELALGQPSFYCQWVPCARGCCLEWAGYEKFYAGPSWLAYLIDTFLRPGAHAKLSGDAQFADFTFDHTMNGVIVGEQQDRRELFLLEVIDNEVAEYILCAGDPDFGEPGFLKVEDRPWLPDERRESNVERNARSCVPRRQAPLHQR